MHTSNLAANFYVRVYNVCFKLASYTSKQNLCRLENLNLYSNSFSWQHYQYIYIWSYMKMSTKPTSGISKKKLEITKRKIGFEENIKYEGYVI